MSMKNIDESLPRVVSTVHKIMDKWKTKKGLIHCNSYKVGQAIYDAMSRTEHSPRLIFPKTADEREKAFSEHAHSLVPTVMISPSMTEGYDFAGELAEWQVIAKVPFPNLGDKHTWARKTADDNWYKMACGRIVRSERDQGVTYILDSDMNRLLDEHADFFPRWWMAAVKRR
jgi:Rad3-related DNA helicase